jgi:hypothetical protein
MRSRMFCLAIAVAALAASLVATPALANVGSATVVVAQGIPGVSLDVCQGGTALKSGLAYGGQVTKTLPVGPIILRFRKHSATACHGTLLASRSLTLTAGESLTLVPRVLNGAYSVPAYINDLLSEYPAATIVVRHAASFGTVDFWVNGGTLPAVSGIASGAKLQTAIFSAGVTALWVSLHGAYAPVMSPIVVKLVGGHCYQLIAVGTSKSNYRFIVINQLAA